jgi:hypothetical protein
MHLHNVHSCRRRTDCRSGKGRQSCLLWKAFLGCHRMLSSACCDQMSLGKWPHKHFERVPMGGQQANAPESGQTRLWMFTLAHLARCADAPISVFGMSLSCSIASTSVGRIYGFAWIRCVLSCPHASTSGPASSPRKLVSSR